jgi:hypothetical protein
MTSVTLIERPQIPSFNIETMYLGEDGLVLLEVKFHHNPDSSHGFCGEALSANVIHCWKDKNEKWQWEKIIDVENQSSGLNNSWTKKTSSQEEGGYSLQVQ